MPPTSWASVTRQPMVFSSANAIIAVTTPEYSIAHRAMMTCAVLSRLAASQLMKSPSAVCWSDSHASARRTTSRMVTDSPAAPVYVTVLF